MRLVERLIGALALSIPAAAGPLATASAACDVCKDEESVTCTGCSGKGSTTEKCFQCESKGKVSCFIDGCGALGKGLLPCPNPACAKGSVKWEDEHVDPCRLCSGRGTVDCPICNDSELPCLRCQGKRSLTWPCLDCRTSGRVPCPLCQVQPDETTCAWCRGSAEWNCPRCKSAGTEILQCPLCRGSGKAICPDCTGLGKVACKSCHGTGWMRIKLVDRKTKADRGAGGRHRHDDCQGKGTVPCPAGDARKADCWMALRLKSWKHENGKLVASCQWCGGEKRLRCGGCDSGGFRVLEVSAQMLSRADHPGEAAALLRSAIARAEAYFARGPRAETKTPEEVTAFTRRRSETLARLQGALAAAEKPSPR